MTDALIPIAEIKINKNIKQKKFKIPTGKWKTRVRKSNFYKIPL